MATAPPEQAASPFTVSSTATPAAAAAAAAASTGSADAPRKQVRVWADGCFDMMHFGHANALRQARAMGDYLIVGVHSDAEVRKNKGPPLMNEKERYAAVRACKWVDEVVEDAPYTTELSFLDKYNVDFCVHGEDASVDANGVDSYHLVKAAGRFRYIKRTESLSTTSLVERLLHAPIVLSGSLPSPHPPMIKSQTERSPYTQKIAYVPTTYMISLFSNRRLPKRGDRVVYMDGSFDLFHLGHIEALRQAREMGDFVIVGLYEDDVVRQLKGVGFPIQTLHERVLTVLACRYVDDVVIGAPFCVNESLLKALNISVVLHGDREIDPVRSLPDIDDPYKVPRQREIYREVRSLRAPTTSQIIARTQDARAEYEERNRRKEEKEVKMLARLHEQQKREAAEQLPEEF